MKPFLPAAMAILASSAFGFTPPSAKAIFPTSTARSMSEASPTEEAFVIDSERRALMNVIVLGSATVTVGAMAVPYLAFFFPPVPGDSTGAIPAKGSYIILFRLIVVSHVCSKCPRTHFPDCDMAFKMRLEMTSF